ncbi:MAG: hypothetical protein M8354_15575, partial [Halalkalicoccus sp.]|nr:hypothetical protein [Halalkalicoccus sp.]
FHALDTTGMATLLDIVYIAIVFLVATGGLIALGYTTRDVRSDRGFTSDVVLTGLVAAFILVLAAMIL